MNNKTIGNSFEEELCQILFEYGFWVHNMAQNKAGQPADIICARNGKAYLIDAKVCSGGKFPLSRVEENQHLSMDLWKARGNGEGWFAFKINHLVLMLPYFTVRAFGNDKSYISAAEIFESGKSLDEWVKKCK